MANDSSAELSAEMVGNVFVSQYYNILHQSPELVHRFYQDTSTMSRPSTDGSLTTVTSMEGIKDLVASLACHEYRAEIKTADAQASYNDGVIVLVTGCLTGKDDIRRKFSETFFLAPQDNGYYVHNDVFRFIHEEVTGVTSPDSDNISTDTLAPAQEVTQEAAQSLPENVVAAVDDLSIPEVEEVSLESSDAKPSAVSDPPTEVMEIKEEQSVAALGPDVPEDAPKKSYASIVKVVKDGKDVPVRTPSKTTRTSVSANGQQLQSAKPSAASEKPNGSLALPGSQQSTEKVIDTVSEASINNGFSGKVNSTVDEAEEKGFSVYIGNLPYNATVAQVENEFKGFGPIRRGGIQVRCNKGFCFGFVEFETMDSMQKALQSSKLHVGGNEVFIEEKKTSTRVVNGVSLFSANGGRGGGYRNNNGFRGGRGNFSNGGRGGGGGGGYSGKSEYGRRNGEYNNNNGAHNGDGGSGGGYSRDRYTQNGGSGGRAQRQGVGGGGGK